MKEPGGVSLEEMEEHALKMLNRRMSEGRWYPRRHFVGLLERFLNAAADAIWSVLAFLWRFPRWLWRLTFGRKSTK